MDDETLLDLPMLMAASLVERAPEIIQALESCLRELQSFVVFAHSSPSANAAEKIVSNQAFNDFIDLCFDLCACRGRSALRGSRALFEHLVNFLDVHVDPSMARRYERHGTVAAQIEATAEYGMEFLSGHELRGARHALRNLARDSKSDYDKAISEYGSKFQRSWNPSNLKDRAAHHGLTGEYSFYKLASAVLHGSAGGVKGTLSSKYERPVHRTGPALEICPLAYLKGLQYFKKFILAAAPSGPKGGEANLISTLDEALALWPAYRRVIMAIDKDIWPKEGLRVPMAIWAINRNGDRKWFLHDPDNRRIIEALPPVESEISSAHKDTASRVFGNLPLPENRDEWITVAMIGVRVVPRRGASWQPDIEILFSPEGEKYQYLSTEYIKGRLGGNLKK